jgi:hypothetical protein
MRWYPSKEQLKSSWEKYSLIVIGNIVFFALLYFISYRPHNEENRAAEFLSLAQAQETQGRNQAAMVIYQKVIKDYGDTRAAETAKSRLPSVKKNLKSPLRAEPTTVEPVLDLDEMLSRSPAVYVATYLAEHYDDDPGNKAKILGAIQQYLSLAASHDGVDFRKLAAEREFQSAFFQREFFAVRPRCVMESDWLYDDFFVTNTNFFPWTNANLKLTVSQGDEQEEQEIRLPRIEPGEKVEMLELWVSSGEGVVTCQGRVTAAEGTTDWSEEI